MTTPPTAIQVNVIHMPINVNIYPEAPTVATAIDPRIYVPTLDYQKQYYQNAPLAFVEHVRYAKDHLERHPKELEHFFHQICPSIIQCNGFCTNNCPNAHHLASFYAKRITLNPLFKTIPCKSFLCQYGYQCAYLHNGDPINPYKVAHPSPPPQQIESKKAPPPPAPLPSPPSQFQHPLHIIDDMHPDFDPRTLPHQPIHALYHPTDVVVQKQS